MHFVCTKTDNMDYLVEAIHIYIYPNMHKSNDMKWIIDITNIARRVQLDIKCKTLTVIIQGASY